MTFGSLFRRIAGMAGAAALAGAALGQSLPESADFDPRKVVEGSVITRQDCAVLERNHTAIWVEAGGDQACLRYYAAGLAAAPQPNPIAAIWLHGDVLGPSGGNADRRQSGFGPSEMVALEQRLVARFGVPSIFIGRPGAYGSSGKHHAMRGRPVEAALIAAALDGIKARYSIQSLALGGHSGGGTLVAEMLARRQDLRCAVISSGAASYRAYLEARGLLRPGEALTRFDPSASLDKVAADPGRRIFVIGDPRETNVPFSSQRLFFDGLVQRGHAAWLLPLERATDARHHDLIDFGETANEMCAAGASTADILAVLRAMPDQQHRLTN
jgi:pimeloyl-ACP methyl ester carboxylesterase